MSTQQPVSQPNDDLFCWESSPQLRDHGSTHLKAVQPSMQDSPPNRIGACRYEENAIVNAIRAQTNNIYTRLLSIEHDTRRTLQLYDNLGNGDKRLPIFRNARAGAWYVPPSDLLQYPSDTCVFKSADGHYGTWAASPRRPNMNVLRAVLQHRGVVIVDVTRAGKRIPDALSKTIPIWCAIINALIFNPNDCDDVGRIGMFLHVHRSITESERSAMVSRLTTIIGTWKAGGMRDHPLIQEARSRGLLPLRTVWTGPSRPTWSRGFPIDDLDFSPIVCISASDAVEQGSRAYVDAMPGAKVGNVLFPSRTGFAYVQGAGDDEESWAHSLTPQMFWRFREIILNLHDLDDAHTVAQAVQIVTTRLERVLQQCCEDESTISTTEVEAVWKVKVSIAQIGKTNVAAQINNMCVTSGPFGAVIVLTGAGDMSEGLDELDVETKKVLQIFEFKTLKGGTDCKYGLERALYRCINMLRKCCVDNGEQALICCTSPSGDWTSGLTISWLLWHCVDVYNPSKEGEKEASEESGMQLCCKRREVVDFVEKDRIHAVMVRFLSTFSRFQLSRATLKQIRRFFMSHSPNF